MLLAGRLVVLPFLYGALCVTERTCSVCAQCIVRWQFTCMQRHEHRSTRCAKLVADCKIHICDVRWARGQFVRQAGKEEDRTSSCCF